MMKKAIFLIAIIFISGLAEADFSDGRPMLFSCVIKNENGNENEAEDEFTINFNPYTEQVNAGSLYAKEVYVKREEKIFSAYFVHADFQSIISISQITHNVAIFLISTSLGIDKSVWELEKELEGVCIIEHL